ncbi:WD40 repeat domain-containing protein [Leptodesmis sichuanensis]|uniref:WD40 repeat domain-containing protein n=1 Tax=Leptodesmis sichuanensis TaxID=2906798 RepID=UPI001F48844B|nr:WD40 repeat domain-containing protein [Leptodesmis sichuanensis]UIE38520.1 WD40 repeat domain-containing protein [Leptodesmis sichuanensis A121]
MQLELFLKLLLQGLPAIAEFLTVLQLLPGYQQASEAGKTEQWVDNRETPLQVAKYQRETELLRLERQKELEHWSLGLLPAQLTTANSWLETTPLKVLLAPLQINGEFDVSVRQHLSILERQLGQGLAEFLQQHYSLQDRDRPVEFLSGAWVHHSLRYEAQIKALFEQFPSQPILILEPEIIGEELSLHMAYWGFGQKQYTYHSVIAHFNYQQLLIAAAKRRALDWKDTADKLLAAGELPELVNQLGGDNAINLELLQKETKWQSLGIHASTLSLQYHLNAKDFAALVQVLLPSCCIFVAGMADYYYLSRSGISPFLPDLVAPLLRSVEQPFQRSLYDLVLSGYRHLLRNLSMASVRNQASDRASMPTPLTAWFTACLAQLEALLAEASQVLSAERVIEVFATFREAVPSKPMQQRPAILLPSMAAQAAPSVRLHPAIAAPSSPLNFPSLFLAYTLSGYAGKAAAIAVSSDNQVLLSAGNDQSIQLRHLQTGELLQSFASHSGRILTLALSTDGQLLGSVHRTSSHSYIRVWKVKTRKLQCTLTGHNKSIRCLAIAPDNTTLISGGQKIKIWDIRTGELQHTLSGHTKLVYAVALSPDGRILASSSADKTVRLWHLPTGKPLYTLVGHQDWVKAIAFSPDGQFLASGSDDNTIKLWHVASGQLVRTFTGHSDWVLAVTFSPDGQTLFSGSKDQTIKLWHLETGNLLGTLSGHRKWVHSLVVSPDGHTLASGSDDNTIRIWRAA